MKHTLYRIKYVKKNSLFSLKKNSNKMIFKEYTGIYATSHHGNIYSFEQNQEISQ